MTLYNVHIYREMRLAFAGIEANSPDEAAATARDRNTAEADAIDDCDGETFSALVDVAGDDQYERSRFIDFEPELLRKAAPELLEALEGLLDAAGDLDAAIDGVTDQFDDERAALDAAYRSARNAIAKATDEGRPA